ncbi:MAG: uncharacterized protein KVP18_002429 [Porospora cf. gigantea A]|uniref:uncharacterized protein n=1 Tax=Porospora cf. gigantea A TaxID=2853593 RepID=UPI003559D6B1|nr:MAG: hypothetical protein KVP18_002429 [Porospora cf. gigantea A]
MLSAIIPLALVLVICEASDLRPAPRYSEPEDDFSFLTKDARLQATDREYWCPDCPTGEACYYLNSIIDGPSLKVTHARSPYDCARACQSRQGCSAISFRVMSGQCFLKSDMPHMSSRSGYVSARADCVDEPPMSDCLEYGTFYYGNTASFLRVGRAIACAEQCNRSAACKYFTFIPSEKACYLKSTRVFATYSGDAVSGTRDCGDSEDPCMDVGTMYRGEIVDSSLKTSAAKCKAACQKHRHCRFFSFDSARFSQLCLLLSSKRGSYSLDDGVSGDLKCNQSPTISPTTSPYHPTSYPTYYPTFLHPTTYQLTTYTGSLLPSVCLKPGATYRGGDLKRTVAADAYSCALTCRDLPGCVRFSFKSYNGGCRLVSGASRPEPRTGVISGDARCLFGAKCLLKRQDYFGHDIDAVRAASVEVCAAMCQLKSKCQFFTFGEEMCYLKSSDSGRRPSPDAVSGSTRCLFGGKCKERLLVGVRLISADGSRDPSSTVLECAQACSAAADCFAFTFRLKKSRCYLKKSVREAVHEPDAVSGFSCL